MNVLLSLAVGALAGTATLASAEISFSPAQLQPSTSSVYFDLVTSEAAGLAEIHSTHGQVAGEPLASPAATSGSTPGLRVQMKPRPFGDLTAVLAIDGAKMVDRVIEVHSHGR